MSIPITGNSMEPFLREGDCVEVVRCERGDFTTGDIIVFPAGGQVLVHRLIRIGPDRFLEMGENRSRGAFYPWPESAGRAVAAVRGGVRQNLSSPEGRKEAADAARRLLLRHLLEVVAEKLPGKLSHFVRMISKRFLKAPY